MLKVSSFNSQVSRSRGFTLIELLVVIAIIGILASIVLASLDSARARGRDASRVTAIKQLQIALALYYDGAGRSSYPVATTNCAHTENAYGLEVLLANNYIPALPRDPSSTSAAPKCYYYATPAAPASIYHLGAKLEQEGGIALGSDSDFDSAAALYTGGFKGNSADCAGAAGDDKCFDATP